MDRGLVFYLKAMVEVKKNFLKMDVYYNHATFHFPRH
jgi:hypothetical protein